MKKLAGLL